MPLKAPSEQLTSYKTLVESPFIIATIGGVTFGHYKKQGTELSFKAEYPNFMQSLKVVKVNGAVNNYTLQMVYGITQGDDPNLLERIFSRASKDRKIILSYGDWNDPTNIYKEEEAIITNINSSVAFANSQIIYTIKAVSESASLNAGVANYQGVKAKPSDLIKEMLTDISTGLATVFSGMSRGQDIINTLIAGNDKVVDIAAQFSVGVIDRISYLVSNMTSVSSTDDNPSKYMLVVDDNKMNGYDGPVMKVVEVGADQANANQSLSVYEIVVGYPGDNLVLDFSLNNDLSWSILYNSDEELNLPSYEATYNCEGQLEYKRVKGVTISKTYLTATDANDIWWKNMTNFPISATLTIKGLTRPTLLASYLRIKSLFYGQAHISSGLYIITRQEDSISSDGYKTTLTLTRVGE